MSLFFSEHFENVKPGNAQTAKGKRKHQLSTADLLGRNLQRRRVGFRHPRRRRRLWSSGFPLGHLAEALDEVVPHLELELKAVLRLLAQNALPDPRLLRLPARLVGVGRRNTT
jgi:hypothetical protein